MNKQEKRKNGKIVGRGIEWTNYTWNPIGGCKHRCRWNMPDGKIAICYAESTANGVAQAAYPGGFEAHYWNPRRLEEPLKVTEPAKIFLDSMSDLMGHWVSNEEINQVLEICKKAHWHTFQLLTKNAPRLLKFDFPPNVWVGISSPPDFMWGKELSKRAKVQMLDKGLSILGKINNTTFLSAEPLSWDIVPILDKYSFRTPLDWVIIGAASDGKKTHQPNQAHIKNLLNHLDNQKVPVFFKGNLKWEPHREDFPYQTFALDKFCLQCDQYMMFDDGSGFCSEKCYWAREIPF